MSQFIANVLNTIGDQEPDLPSLRTDSLAMSLIIPSTSTRERAQFISGHVDGTVRFHTSRPAHEWWKPAMYDEKDVDFHDYEEDEDDAESEDDEVAEDAFNTDWNVRASLLSIRAVDAFPKNNTQIAAASRDGSLSVLDVEQGKVLFSTQKSHKCGFEVMKCWDNNLIVAGDEEGACIGYDIRMDMTKDTTFNQKVPSAKNGIKAKSVPKNLPMSSDKPHLHQTWLEDDNGDYMTDICINKRHSQAIFTSADKYVSSYDLKSGRFHNTSMNFDELMSCCMLKDDELIVTGSHNGPLTTYNWANMDNLADRFAFQNCAVEKLHALDDDTILAGTDDGILRLLTINPTRVIGVVAVHKAWFTSIGTQRGMLSKDDFIWANDLICAASADNIVRFWDIQDMQLVRQNLTNKEKRSLDKKKVIDWDSSDDEDSGKGKKRKNLPQNDSDSDLGNTNNKKQKKNTIVDSDDSEYIDDSDDDTLADDLDAFHKLLASYDQDFENMKQEKLRQKHGKYIQLAASTTKDDDIGNEDEEKQEMFISDDDFEISDEDDLDLLSTDDDGDDVEEEDDDLDEDDSDMDFSDDSDDEAFKAAKNIKVMEKKNTTLTTKKPTAKNIKIAVVSAPKILDATEFDGKSFRKAHGHKLSDASSNGYYKGLNLKKKEKKQQQEQKAAGNKIDTSKVNALPDISHKLPKVAKLKHGSSNFFGGLNNKFVGGGKKKF